jgi:hypothetical protein
MVYVNIVKTVRSAEKHTWNRLALLRAPVCYFSVSMITLMEEALWNVLRYWPQADLAAIMPRVSCW